MTGDYLNRFKYKQRRWPPSFGMYVTNTSIIFYFILKKLHILTKSNFPKRKVNIKLKIH